MCYIITTHGPSAFPSMPPGQLWGISLSCRCVPAVAITKFPGHMNVAKLDHQGVVRHLEQASPEQRIFLDGHHTPTVYTFVCSSCKAARAFSHTPVECSSHERFRCLWRHAALTACYVSQFQNIHMHHIGCTRPWHSYGLLLCPSCQIMW